MACYVKNTIFELESLLILMHGSFPTPGGVTLQFYKLGIYKSNAEQSDGANTDSYVAGFTDSVVSMQQGWRPEVRIKAHFVGESSCS